MQTFQKGEPLSRQSTEYLPKTLGNHQDVSFFLANVSFLFMNHEL